MESVYKCAFLQFDITPNVSPEKPVLLQGFFERPRSATAAAIPLSMELCLLEDSNCTKLLIVSADIFGFDEMTVNTIYHQAAEWGLLPQNILLSASHPHNAPGTLSKLPKAYGPFYEGYAKQLSNIIIEYFIV
ncbi:hypothetical protein [Desulfosarcina ovata]|uniref:Neutral/alkaline non-lysosomal ceramidase N-terminal domain-containing protein n=1 Tax=Desulfosarcina ovata subsp. ovata TaxID=2752305 RepID=A0A5K8A6W5_9BACT|nr:hypothetical protein [Desulfosarcina ovata]BBO88352.1 hypothetical protein DSCOOX_15320 [Desulfosarcina ovata subsp. ovata]